MYRQGEWLQSSTYSAVISSLVQYCYTIYTITMLLPMGFGASIHRGCTAAKKSMKCRKFFGSLFSVISKSSHSNCMLCTVLPASMHNTTLTFF